MTRAEKAAEARRLRHQGLKNREIADRLGVACSTAGTWLSDPDGSKLRARQDSYRGTCKGCGAPTSGCRGPVKAPKRCRDCMNERYAERDELLREMWEAGVPTWYIAQELGMAENTVTAWVSARRHRNGEMLSLRRLGGNAEERKRRHRRMIALRLAGHSNAEIAEIVGMASGQSVSNTFAGMRRKGWDVPPAPTPDREQAGS